MRAFCRRTVCVILTAALLISCGFTAFAVNEYMLDAHWKSVSHSDAADMLRNGDTFVLYCYRATCGNSRYIGAKVLMDWMDTYGKQIQGLDVDAADGVPSFVWTALGRKSATLPFVAFVRGGEVKALSPEGDLESYAQLLNDTFFAFYTDVTRVRLSVLTMPDKTVYQTGEPLDTTGMSLQAVHADGSVATVTAGFVCEGFSSDSPGHRTVTVSYDGLRTAFTAVVNTPDGKPSVWIVQPARNKLRYGRETTLTADFCNMPEDTHVNWSYGFGSVRGRQTKAGTGASFSLTAEGFSQVVTVTAAAVSADGTPVTDQDGNAVAAQHEIRFQNNIFFRLQIFFENLFRRSGCGSKA